MPANTRRLSVPDRLRALAAALEDARHRLPLYYTTGSDLVADDLLGGLATEATEIASAVDVIVWPGADHDGA